MSTEVIRQYVPQTVVVQGATPVSRVVQQTTQTQVVKQVEAGPQGIPGSAAATYTHLQTAALSIWTVPHNLGRKPSITVVDNLDQRIEPDVTYIDDNTVRITHGSALTGKVYCN